MWHGYTHPLPFRSASAAYTSTTRAHFLLDILTDLSDSQRTSNNILHELQGNSPGSQHRWGFRQAAPSWLALLPRYRVLSVEENVPDPNVQPDQESSARRSPHPASRPIVE